MPIEGISRPGEGALPLMEAAGVRAGRATGLTPQLTLEPESFAAGPAKPTAFVQLGQEIEGKLLAQVAADQFLVDIAGNRLVAIVPEGIPDGQPVRLRVAEVQPQLVLHVFDSGPFIEAEMVGLIRAHLGETFPAGVSLANLQQVLAQLTAGEVPEASLPGLSQLPSFLQTFLNPRAALDADGIAHWVQDGGLHYEAKLARLVQTAASTPGSIVVKDLKGLLLRAEQDLTAAASSPHGSVLASQAEASRGPQSAFLAAAAQASTHLSDLVTSYLGHLEIQQALNLLAQLHSTPYQLQIPLFTGRTFSTVYLGIEPDAQRNEAGAEGTPRGYNLFFQLDLEEYGPTRIDARFMARSIRVNFFLAPAQAVAEVRTELPVLQQALRTAGFEEVLLAADLVDYFPPDKSHKLAALIAGVPSKVHLFDVRV